MLTVFGLLVVIATANAQNVYTAGSVPPQPPGQRGPSTDATQVPSPADSANAIRPYKLGEAVEDFRLQNIDGRFVSLRDYPDAKGFIVVFTCNNCPCAADYQKRLIWMNRKYEPKGYPVLAINANKADRKFGESLEDMRLRSDTSGFNFPYLIDETQAVARRYGASKTPEAFLLMGDASEPGVFRLHYSGAIDDKPADPHNVKRFYIGEAIALHEQGYPPALARVEPMGCTIEGVGIQGKYCPMEALENKVKASIGQ
jgi:peroxiredoxin